jgi:hypothetical protein
MEFAITVPAPFTGSDDSWQMRARSFLFTELRVSIGLPSSL